MKNPFPLLIFSVATVFAEDRTKPIIALATRPDVPFIRVDQFRNQGAFIVWSPSLTLAQVIEAIGGLVPRNDRIEITHLASDPTPDVVFSKNKLLQDPKIQSYKFHPGDRVSIDFIIPPIR